MARGIMIVLGVLAMLGLGTGVVPAEAGEFARFAKVHKAGMCGAPAPAPGFHYLAVVHCAFYRGPGIFGGMDAVDFLDTYQVQETNHPNITLVKDPYNQGFDFYCQGRYKKAEAEYRKGLEKNPASPGVNIELGRLLRELGRLKEARQHLLRAHQFAPKIGATAAELGALYLALKKWSSTEKYLKKAVKADPKDSYSHWRLGCTYIKKDDVEKAEVSLRAALEANPDLSLAWMSLGELQQKKGLKDKALASFQAASEADPSSGPAFDAFAKAVEESGTADQKAYVAAFKEHNEGKMDAAEKRVRELHTGNASEPRYHILLGHILLHQTPPKADLAAAAYKEGLDLDSRAEKAKKLPRRFRSNALEGSGICHLILGDMPKAKAAFEQGSEVDPDYPGHFFYLAVVETQDKKQNKHLIFINLRRVCNRDRGAKWRKMVMEDSVFAPHRKSKEFKAATGP